MIKSNEIDTRSTLYVPLWFNTGQFPTPNDILTGIRTILRYDFASASETTMDNMGK